MSGVKSEVRNEKKIQICNKHETLFTHLSENVCLISHRLFIFYRFIENDLFYHLL